MPSRFFLKLDFYQWICYTVTNPFSGNRLKKRRQFCQHMSEISSLTHRPSKPNLKYLALISDLVFSSDRSTATLSKMTRGNQRDLAREKAAKKDKGKSKAANEQAANAGMTKEQRMARFDCCDCDC